MKKILAILALSTAFAASATTVTVGFTDNKSSSNTTSVALSQITPLGVIDGKLNGTNTGAYSGYEVGYSLTTKVFGLTLTPRTFAGDAPNGKFIGVSGSVAAPIAPSVSVFAQYGIRKFVDSSSAATERQTDVGVKYDLTKNWATSIAYQRTDSGPVKNGVGLSVSYSF